MATEQHGKESYVIRACTKKCSVSRLILLHDTHRLKYNREANAVWMTHFD